MQIACLIPDPSVFRAACRQLASQGHECIHFTTDAALLRGIGRIGADVILVDVGWDAEQESRILTWAQCRQADSIPLVMQSPDPGSARVARALQAGVDDLIGRGADALELAARLHAAQRRQRRGAEAYRIEVAGFELQRAGSLVRDRGLPVALTAREFALAWLMFAQAGRCVSRQTISVAVWGTDSDISGRTMEEHVHRLRRKLGLDAARGVTLRAAYGQGYRLEVQARQAESGAALYQGPERRRMAAAGPLPGAESGAERLAHLSLRRLQGSPKNSFSSAASPSSESWSRT